MSTLTHTTTTTPALLTAAAAVAAHYAAYATIIEAEEAWYIESGEAYEESYYRMDFEYAYLDWYIEDNYISFKDGVVRADGKHYCTNPYVAEIHGRIENEWISADDHYEMCQDI